MKQNNPGQLDGASQTPLEDLKQDALSHYDELSIKATSWNSSVPRALQFYFEYHQMTFWQKIKLAFKK